MIDMLWPAATEESSEVIRLLIRQMAIGGPYSQRHEVLADALFAFRRMVHTPKPSISQPLRTDAVQMRHRARVARRQQLRQQQAA